MNKTFVEVNLPVLRQLQRDAERYRFMRDEDNWGDDSGEDTWDLLGQSHADAFDKIVDSRIEKAGLEGAQRLSVPEQSYEASI